MSTRSLIGRRTKDGGIEAVYCHCDGYPEHHMPILRAHYNTEEAVEELLALGDLSVLGPELGEKHDFRTHGEVAGTENWCLAYSRDRGDREAKRRTYADEKELLVEAGKSWAEYVYLFEDGRWVWREVRMDRTWRRS